MEMMKVGATENANELISSLAIAMQVNVFRAQEGNRAELGHNDLLKVIRDEFAEEIGLGEISQSSYTNSQNKLQPMYNLTLQQARQVLLRESKFVRKSVLQFIDELEQRLKGGFNIPTTLSGALLLASQQAEVIEQQQVLLAKQAPKVLFADSVCSSSSSVLVGELAKVLKQNGVEMGQNRLFGWLRENGYLCSRKGVLYNVPTQRSMEMGLFDIKTTAINKPDGSTLVTSTTKVTGKGQIYFINKFLAN